MILVDEARQGIGRVAVEEDVEFAEPRRTEAGDMVVERGVALGYGFQLVVEVEDHLRQRQVVAELDAVGRDVVLADESPSLIHAELHDGAVEIGLGDNLGADEGLFYVVDEGRSRKAGRVVDIHHVALCRVDFIGNVGDGRDDIHVKFTEKTLLNYLQMEKSEEAAAEAEAESQRGLGLIDECRIVEAELLEGSAEFLIFRSVDGVHTREDHRLHLLEPGYGFPAGLLDVGDGVAHADLHGTLDAGDDVAHIARRNPLAGAELELQHADFFSFIFPAGGDEFHLVADRDATVDDLEIRDDPPERIEHGVEDEGLQRRIRVSDRCRNLVHDGVKHGLHTYSRPRRDFIYILRLAAEKVTDLVRHDLHLCGVHIDLVEYRDDLQTVIDGLIEIGNGLRLDALGGVHDQQSPFARSDAAGYLVGEIHVAGSVDEVEKIGLPVPAVLHLDGVALYSDAFLALKVHIVEHLVFHLAGIDRAGKLQQAVGEGALAVVDVRNYAEIPNILHILQIYEEFSIFAPMENDWKKRLGVVFSTNPDFKYEEATVAAQETLPPGKQKLIVGIDRRNRGGKQVTLVTGFVGTDEDLKELGRALKVKCGVGGSAKDGEITVQGDFRDKVTALLREMGYTLAKRGN